MVIRIFIIALLFASCKKNKPEPTPMHYMCATASTGKIRNIQVRFVGDSKGNKTTCGFIDFDARICTRTRYSVSLCHDYRTIDTIISRSMITDSIRIQRNGSKTFTVTVDSVKVNPMIINGWNYYILK